MVAVGTTVTCGRLVAKTRRKAGLTVTQALYLNNKSGLYELYTLSRTKVRTLARE